MIPKHIAGYVTSDIRICFSIHYFNSPEGAAEYAKEVKADGATYNGGFFHGMPCGREKTWDHTDKDGRKLYAVTD